MDIGGNQFVFGFSHFKQRTAEIDIAGRHGIGFIHDLLTEIIGGFLDILQIAVNLPSSRFVVKNNRRRGFIHFLLDQIIADPHFTDFLDKHSGGQIPADQRCQIYCISESGKSLCQVESHSGQSAVHPEKVKIYRVVVDWKTADFCGGFEIQKTGNEYFTHLNTSLRY